MRRLRSILSRLGALITIIGILSAVSCQHMSEPLNPNEPGARIPGESEQIVSGTWKGQQVEYYGRQVIVAVTDHITPGEVAGLLRRYHLTIVQDFDKLGTALVEVPESADLMQIISQLNHNTLIRYAEPNLVERAFGDTASNL